MDTNTLLLIMQINWEQPVWIKEFLHNRTVTFLMSTFKKMFIFANLSLFYVFKKEEKCYNSHTNYKIK